MSTDIATKGKNPSEPILITYRLDKAHDFSNYIGWLQADEAKTCVKTVNSLVQNLRGSDATHSSKNENNNNNRWSLPNIEEEWSSFTVPTRLSTNM